MRQIFSATPWANFQMTRSEEGRLTLSSAVGPLPTSSDLEEETAPYSKYSVANPTDRGAWGLSIQSTGSQRVGHDLAAPFKGTQTHTRRVSRRGTARGLALAGRQRLSLTAGLFCAFYVSSLSCRQVLPTEEKCCYKKDPELLGL